MAPDALAYVPAVQLAQVPTADAPSATENVPATQPTHAAERAGIATPVPYVPAPHGVHTSGVPRPVAYVPALHAMQTADDVPASAKPYLPTPHAAHAVMPVAFENVPAAHAAQL